MVPRSACDIGLGRSVHIDPSAFATWSRNGKTLVRRLGCFWNHTCGNIWQFWQYKVICGQHMNVSIYLHMSTLLPRLRKPGWYHWWLAALDILPGHGKGREINDKWMGAYCFATFCVMDCADIGLFCCHDAIWSDMVWFWFYVIYSAAARCTQNVQRHLVNHMIKSGSSGRQTTPIIFKMWTCSRQFMFYSRKILIAISCRWPLLMYLFQHQRRLACASSVK